MIGGASDTQQIVECAVQMGADDSADTAVHLKAGFLKS